MQIQWKRRLQIIGILLVVYLAVRFALPPVLPFLAAWWIAGKLYPKVRKLEKRTGIKKTLSATVFLGVAAIFLGFLFYLGLGELIEQGRAVLSASGNFDEWSQKFLGRCCAQLEQMTGIEAAKSQSFLLTQTKQWKTQAMTALGGKTVAGVYACAKKILGLLSALAVTGILSILMIGDMENLQKNIRKTTWLLGIRHVLERMGKTVLTYMKAQLVIIFLVSCVCALGFWLMKSPYFLILGIILGALDALPVIGTGTFLYPAAVVFVLQGKTMIALGCVLLDLVTSLLREFLEPRLLGEKLGISPVYILAAVYGGIFLYGIWGVFLGPLSFSAVYEIGKEADIWD
jgi:sporulation integral membrane protein YtvI